MDDTPIDGYIHVEEETPAQETTRERRPKRRRRIKRIRPERAPASLIHGVFSVVGQEKVLTVWLLLSLGASGVGLICRWMISLVPS